MTNNKLANDIQCSGCGACSNVCPVNAIDMKYNQIGFIMPEINNKKCIDCGLCSKTCPVLHSFTQNNPEPDFYSFCASDEIRKKSSSGGMFSVIANYVLDKKGYVCGAAFDENFQVKHRIINSKEELEPLCYSKYVQSDVNDCYKQIKSLLDNGKYVFFTGTPCQVAGLYGVLKKKYSNLITADLLCHGVPSQKFFDRYLSDISKSNGKKIKNVYFRNKKFGWSTVMNIVFEDSSEYVGRVSGDKKDPYFEAFMKNMMMRRSCYDCKFCDYPRQGDFTIGDLWHSDKLDPESNDRKGTSFVFVNNSRADKIFHKISSEAKYYNKITVSDYSKIPNRVTPKSRINPKRMRFLRLMRANNDFIKSFEYAYNGYFDIGLVGVMGNDNIGSILTYYGLYNTLCDMNYSVMMIERPLNSSLPVSEKARKFNNKWIPDYSRPVQYKNIMEMRELNSRCGQFVVGSDQIYLAKMSASREDCYFLQWAEDSKNKIGYACSFGGPGARGSEEYYRRLSYYLNKFSFISSRENDGVELANNTLGLDKKAVWCIDPVFLCDKRHYMKLVKSANVKRTEDFIGAYVVIPKPSINSFVKKTADKFNLPVEIIGDEKKLKQSAELSKYKCRDSFPVPNALETIYSSRFFVTDSFHGVCFAIIFKKDFLVMPRDFMDRFTSLLDRLGLSDRIIKPNLSNLTDESFKPIDYNEVYKKLEKEVETSRALLSEALMNKPENKLSDLDVAMKYIRLQSQELAEMKTKIEQLEKLIKSSGATNSCPL